MSRSQSDEDGRKLTRNQQLVLDHLRQADGPLSAYAILDGLRPEGIKAPPQVYRALDRLVTSGMVHRLESLNAFVSCSHDHHGADDAIFAICDGCGSVRELHAAELGEALRNAATGSDFRAERLVAEVHGRCGECDVELAEAR